MKASSTLLSKQYKPKLTVAGSQDHNKQAYMNDEGNSDVNLRPTLAHYLHQ
jgi:hypothetical protein